MQVNRQQSIIDYMMDRGEYGSVTTKMVATRLGITTDAVLSAFKRMRKSGKAFTVGGGYWYLSNPEINRQLELRRSMQSA